MTKRALKNKSVYGGGLVLTPLQPPFDNFDERILDGEHYLLRIDDQYALSEAKFEQSGWTFVTIHGGYRVHISHCDGITEVS